MNKPYTTLGTPNENLPAPSWTPTGESGYWVWRDEKWSWLTDEEYNKLKVEEDAPAGCDYGIRGQNERIRNS